MIRTKVHMCLSVRGALWNRAYLERSEMTLVGSMTNSETGEKLSSTEIFHLLCDSLEKGEKVLPMGDCSNFDAETGCRGHRYDDQETTLFRPGRHDRGYSHV